MPARLPSIPVKRGYRSATNSLEENPSRSPTPEHLQPCSKTQGLVLNLVNLLIRERNRLTIVHLIGERG